MIAYAVSSSLRPKIIDHEGYVNLLLSSNGSEQELLQFLNWEINANAKAVYLFSQLSIRFSKKSISAIVRLPHCMLITLYFPNLNQASAPSTLYSDSIN